MINIMKTFKFLMPFLLVAFALVGCNTDDLRNDIDELKNRVESLEAQVSALNDNLNALRVLVDGNKTIQSYNYDETSGKYTVTLSDGSEIVLTQGTKGSVSTPSISISEDGYWVINGEKQTTKAEGIDAATPKFRINSDGYWQVDLDGDGPKDYENVLGEDGEPVKATTDQSISMSDEFFESVEEKDGCLVVKLKDGGQTYSLPIVEDLICEIVDPTQGFKDGVLTVGYGQLVELTVKVKGDNCAVTAPAGWTAILSEPSAETNEAKLSLTAPSQNSLLSRATADNTKDLTLQVNSGINWAVDKIQVVAKNIVDSYYALYEEGKDIVIEGITINKEKFGEATLVENSTSIVDAKAYGVYFVKSGATLSYDVTNSVSSKYLIVIGDSENDNTATFKLNQRIQTNMTTSPTEIDGYYVWNNIKFDAADLNSQVFVSYRNGEQDKKILFNNCMMDLPAKNFFELTTDGRYFKDMVIKNSRIKLNGNMFLINLGEKNKSTSFGNLTIENNIFYTPNQATTLNNFKILNTGNAKDAQLTNLVINKNTFINIAPNWSGMYYQAKLVSVNMENNIFWYAKALEANGIVLRPANTPSSVKCLNNIGFSLQSTNRWVAAFGEITNWNAEAQEITNLYGESLDVENNPFNGGKMDFETGTFVPNSTYSGYGATIE